MKPNIYERADIVADELLLQIEHILCKENPVGRMVEPSHSSTQVYICPAYMSSIVTESTSNCLRLLVETY